MTIAGRVLDEHGQPLKNAWVYLVRRRPTPPFAVDWGLRAVASTRTDDSGGYRLSGLDEGVYYCRAAASPFARPPTDVLVTGHAPTYYPGVVDSDDARPIPVSPGHDAVGVDFALAKAPVFCISGVVLDSHGGPAPNRDGIRTTLDVRQLDDGTFTLRNLLPGKYVLTAYTRGEAGRVEVKVGNRDLAGVTITTVPGATVAGQVVFDGVPPPESRRVVVMAHQDEFESPNLGPGRATVDDAGMFTYTGILGPTLFRVYVPSPGWALAGVYLQGRDVTDEPVVFKGTERMTGLRIVLTDKTTHVRCLVTDGHGKPTLAYVMVYASDSARWGAYSRYRRTDMALDDGPVVFDGLPPGDYLAVAIPIRHEILARSGIDVRERLRRFATPFTLHTRETKDLSLTLVEPPVR